MARLINALEQILDDNGDPLASGLLDFYESGGSTVRKTTYADSAETIENANPLEINGDGTVPNVFGTGTYRVVVRTAEGAQLRQRDPVGGETSLGFGSDWVSTTSYGLAEVVKEDGQYWESQTAANAGNQPSLDSGTNWLLFLSGVATNTADIADKADLTGAAFTGAISTITSNTVLSDADATLTAAQLIGGEFTITPTVARTLTTDTAANIIAAMTDSVDDSSFEITITNLAVFDVTIAAGAGVSLIGDMATNDDSSVFRVKRLTGTTVSIRRLGNSSSILTRSYTSGEEGISAGSSVLFTHGLGKTPEIITFKLKCAVAEDGYSIGEEILISPNIQGDFASNKGISTTDINSTTFAIRYGSNTNVFNALVKGTGVGAELTNSSWRLIAKAFA